MVFLVGQRGGKKQETGRNKQLPNFLPEEDGLNDNFVPGKKACSRLEFKLYVSTHRTMTYNIVRQNYFG